MRWFVWLLIHTRFEDSNAGMSDNCGIMQFSEKQGEKRERGKASVRELHLVIRLRSVESVLGFLFFLRLRTCPIYAQTRLYSTLHHFLLSSLHPSNSSGVSRNFYSIIPSFSFHPLILFLPSSVILHSPDTSVCFLTLIM